MSTFLSVLSSVFWGILVLSILVFLHEGGHYLAARAFRVRVTEFFLGMPCPVSLSHKSKSHGTEFGVTPILLGGYTRICGMEYDFDDHDDLAERALWLVHDRGIISLPEAASELGVDEDRALNVLLMLKDWASIGLCVPTGQEDPDDPLHFCSLARDAHMLTEYDDGHDFSLPGSTSLGDHCLPDCTPREFLHDEMSRTYLGASLGKRLAMLLGGPVVNLLLALVLVTGSLMLGGVEYVSNVSTLGGIAEGSYAEAAGITAGDTITAVGDVQVDTWDGLCEALDPYLNEGIDFEVTYLHDGVTHTVLVDVEDGVPTMFGIQALVETYHPSLPQALGAAFSYAAEVGRFALRLITPTRTVEVLEQSSSVVGISVMAAEAAESGPNDLVLLVAAVSMSLGFMNLLPIPPLDGGKILIELIQATTGRRLSVRVQNAISYVGLAFFVFVFLFVLHNDIVRYVLG